ncbi:MAG: Smr/MutS family protein [Treponema sp.]|nr:Smr/MutS family protein [Treponema sp.]
MDFGDILNQWEEHQKSEARRQKESGKNTVSHKKANAPTPEEKALKKMHEGFDYNAERDRRINPMELWLRRYGTVDKDSLNEQEEARERYKSRSALVSMRCEARIDLHGLKQEEAWSRLNAFVTDCEVRKIKKIMIVHGKGLHTHGTDPVLGEMVRKFIEQDKRLGTSGHPDYNEGGKGATWVILKNNLFK